jgi:hypothetical protein
MMCKTSQNSEDLRYNYTLSTGRHHAAHNHKMDTEMGPECIHLVQWTVRFQALKASSFLSANVFPHTTLHYDSQPKALITSKGYHIPVNRMVWRGMQYSTGDEEGAVSWDFCLWPLHSKTTDCASPLPTICISQGKPTSKEN